MPRKRTPKVDLDSRWKQIIERLAKEFLAFHLLDLHDQTDWAIGVRSASNELQKLFPQASKEGRRFPDMLLEVPLLAGDVAFVIAHVEVEGSSDQEMPERVFNYLMPLWNKFPRRIVTLVIYTGKHVPEKFGVFIYERFGTKISYEFNTYLVRDQKEEELLKSENPFALVMLACLYNIQHAGKRKLRYLLECKKKLAELCFERNYTQKQLEELLTFVQWVMALPEQEEIEYIQTVHELINKRMDTRPLVEQDKQGADFLLKVFLGKTSDEIYATIQQAKALAIAEALVEIERTKAEAVKEKVEAMKVKVQAMKVTVEAVKAKAEAEVELEALKRKYIWQLHLHGDKPEDIARMAKKSVHFVKKTIREMKNANVNGGVEN